MKVDWILFKGYDSNVEDKARY